MGLIVKHPRWSNIKYARTVSITAQGNPDRVFHLFTDKIDGPMIGYIRRKVYKPINDSSDLIVDLYVHKSVNFDPLV